LPPSVSTRWMGQPAFANRQQGVAQKGRGGLVSQRRQDAGDPYELAAWHGP
jgi:hypothetical protein